MRNLLFIISTLLIVSSCATTKEAKLARKELKNEKKLAEQVLIEKAVESRRFIIKLDRIYFTRGGFLDLKPRNNYIIIDGKKAIISAAYIGRQYDIKPIAGISMHGEAKNYEMSNNTSKGLYKIKMDVDNEFNSFNINLTVGNNGSCTASLSSMKIDFVSYHGHIVPIEDNTVIALQNGSSI